MEQEMTNEVQETPVSSMSADELATALKGQPINQTVEDEGTPESKKTGVDDKSAEGTDTNGTVSKEDFDALQEKWSAAQKKAEHQDKMLARLGTELGLLRKSTPEDETARLEQIRQVYWEDPVAGHKALEEWRIEQKTRENQKHQDEQIEAYEKNRSNVTSWSPDFESSIDDMAEIIKQDGVDAASIEAFKKQPYVLDATTLYNLNMRAKLYKSNAVLQAELESLKKENESLKAKPSELVEKIEKAATQSKTITAKTGGGKTTETIENTKPVYRMSREELQRVYKGGM
jgi:hypothetical protein